MTASITETINIDHTYDSRSKILVVRAGGHSLRVEGVDSDRAAKFVDDVKGKFEERSVTLGAKRALDGLFSLTREFNP